MRKNDLQAFQNVKNNHGPISINPIVLVPHLLLLII